MSITPESTTNGQGTSSPLTYNHTLNSGTDRVVTVSVSHEIADSAPTGVTYGGNAMTQLNTITVGGTFRNHSQIWGILDTDLPANGSRNVAITFPGSGGNMVASASTWNGITIQVLPATAQKDTSSDENVATLDLTPTTIKSTDLVLGTNSSGDSTTWTNPSGYTQLMQLTQGTHTGSAWYKIGGHAATTQLTLTSTTTSSVLRLTGAVVIFEGDAVAGGTNRLLLINQSIKYGGTRI